MAEQEHKKYKGIDFKVTDFNRQTVTEELANLLKPIALKSTEQPRQKLISAIEAENTILSYFKVKYCESYISPSINSKLILKKYNNTYNDKFNITRSSFWYRNEDSKLKYDFSVVSKDGVVKKYDVKNAYNKSRGHIAISSYDLYKDSETDYFLFIDNRFLAPTRDDIITTIDKCFIVSKKVLQLAKYKDMAKATPLINNEHSYFEYKIDSLGSDIEIVDFSSIDNTIKVNYTDERILDGETFIYNSIKDKSKAVPIKDRVEIVKLEDSMRVKIRKFKDHIEITSARGYNKKIKFYFREKAEGEKQNKVKIFNDLDYFKKQELKSRELNNNTSFGTGWSNIVKLILEYQLIFKYTDNLLKYNQIVIVTHDSERYPEEDIFMEYDKVIRKYAAQYGKSFLLILKDEGIEVVFEVSGGKSKILTLR